MQYIPCNGAFLAEEILFLTQKGIFLPKDLQKVRKLRQNSVCSGLNFFVRIQTFRGGPPHAPAQLLPPWGGEKKMLKEK